MHDNIFTRFYWYIILRTTPAIRSVIFMLLGGLTGWGIVGLLASLGVVNHKINIIIPMISTLFVLGASYLNVIPKISVYTKNEISRLREKYTVTSIFFDICPDAEQDLCAALERARWLSLGNNKTTSESGLYITLLTYMAREHYKASDEVLGKYLAWDYECFQKYGDAYCELIYADLKTGLTPEIEAIVENILVSSSPFLIEILESTPNYKTKEKSDSEEGFYRFYESVDPCSMLKDMVSFLAMLKRIYKDKGYDTKHLVSMAKIRKKPSAKKMASLRIFYDVMHSLSIEQQIEIYKMMSYMMAKEHEVPNAIW